MPVDVHLDRHFRLMTTLSHATSATPGNIGVMARDGTAHPYNGSNTAPSRIVDAYRRLMMAREAQ